MPRVSNFRPPVIPLTAQFFMCVFYVDKGCGLKLCVFVWYSMMDLNIKANVFDHKVGVVGFQCLPRLHSSTEELLP
jgi:hypothetical protein